MEKRRIHGKVTYMCDKTRIYGKEMYIWKRDVYMEKRHMCVIRHVCMEKRRIYGKETYIWKSDVYV